MSAPYIGEIRLLAITFAPKGWATCSGQILLISQYQALFSLLGTYYGGNGTNTFGLPNLQGRVAISAGSGSSQNYTMGDIGGEAQHLLTINEMPFHTHSLNANNTTTNGQATPANASLGVSGASTVEMTMYGTGAPQGTLANQTVGNVGGQAHPNMMPYLTLNYCIALQGIFPSRG